MAEYDAAYRRNQYLRHRERILAKQKEYDDAHRAQISARARARYRAKCGLPPQEEKCER